MIESKSKIMALVAATVIAACSAPVAPGGPSSGEGSSERTFDSTEAPIADEDAVAGAPANAEDEAPSISLSEGAYASSISHNHPTGHTLVIPGAALASGNGNVFRLTRGGDAFGETHDHVVALPREAMAKIAAGETVTVESTPGGEAGGHTHTVVLKLR